LGGNAWEGVGTRSHTFFALDYIKTWLRSHGCVSDTQINTANQKSTMRQGVPVRKFL